MLLQLQHPHIVRFCGIYIHVELQTNDFLERYFMVTEFAERGSLETHVTKGFGPCPYGAPLSLRLAWVRVVSRECLRGVCVADQLVVALHHPD